MQNNRIFFEDISNIFALHGVKNIVIVHGKNSYKLSGAKKKVEKYIKNVNIFHFNDFTPDPILEDVIKGRDYALENKIDAIIAVGGGSAIDVGKSIKALYNFSGEIMDVLTGKLKLSINNLIFLAIPLTAGSGSESTHFSVIYIDKKKIFSCINRSFAKLLYS